MMQRTVSVIAMAILVGAGFGWADQITMKNGDRVTGSIVKKDGANLVVKSALFGTITLPWEQVEGLQTDQPLHVSVGGGEATASALAVAGGRAEVAGRSVAMSEVTAVRDAAEQASYERLLAPGWGELWAGSANLGWAGAAGNARTQTLTVGMNSARTTNSDKTALYFSAIKASALVNGTNSSTAQAVRGGVSYDHNVSPRLFVNVFNDYEYDQFQSLDLRFALGGGLGFHLWKNESSRLDLVGGPSYSRQKFSTPLTRNSAEFYWGDDYSLKLHGATSLKQSFRMFNNLSETGDYRMNGELGLTSKIAKWLAWNAGLSDRYLKKPAPGRKTNDLLYTTGLGITFGQ